jgi:hypothetical protein
MLRAGRAVSWGLLVLSLATRVGAQTGLTGAALEGTVRDESGQPLAGAAVEVAEERTGLARKTTTATDGRYALPALPLGSYRLRIEYGGYQAVVRTGLAPGLGQVLVVDVALSPAFVETVSVEHKADAGGLAGAAVAAVVGAPTIEGLPTNGRDYVGFALLTPGVVAERSPPTGPTTSSGLSFGGQRARSNHVMVDGFDNDEVFTGAVAASFSQDAVREFQVLAASAPPELGHASGGTVNTVTRSGTNELHGGAYLFFRDDVLNAKEHFEEFDVFGNPIDSPKAPFRQTQSGATFSGPLRKDRTFFFLSYERLDTSANNFVTIDPAVATSLGNAGFAVELGRAPYAVSTQSALIRVDHGSSPDHRLLFRAHLSRRRNENIEPFGGIVARSHGAVQDRDDWGLALGRTDFFSSGWLSEARLQVVRGDQRVHGLDPRCGGRCDEIDQGGPEVTLSGLAVAGRQLNTPQDRANLAVQLAETLTRNWGRHTLKAGFDLDLGWWDATLAQDFGGRYVFTALPAVPGLTSGPLTALQAFDQGLPAVYVQGYGDPFASGATRMFSLFGQDHWRVSPRWSVIAGVRYQYYDLGLSTLSASAPGGERLVYQVPAHGNVAPRLAVSYDPTGVGRTSLRAAFGLFYEDPLLAVAAATEIFDGQQLRLLQARLPLSAEAWRSPGNRLPEPASLFPSLMQVAGPGFRAPRSTQLSAGVTHGFGRDLHLTLDLIAVRGDDQIGIVDYNPLLPALGPGRRPNDVAGLAGTSASVNQFTNYGESSYHGLAVSLRKRVGRAFEGAVSYTLSDAEDMGSDMFGQSNVAEDPGLGRDPSDVEGLPRGFAPAAFRGPSLLDQRHRLVMSALAMLPWRLGLSAIVTAGSGRPFTALSGMDSNGDGVAANDRARRDPADPASRVGRNHERLAGTATVDARLSRLFGLSRGTSLEVIVEGFNLFDRVNYTEVNNVFGPGAFPDHPQTDAAGRVTYGRYVKAAAPRQVQVAARLTF